MKHLCVLPFSGLSNSLHDDSLDQALNQIFSDRDTGCSVHEGLVHRAWDKIDWRQAHVDYCREYCENFAHEFKLDLAFDEMNSPKEYNWLTDRIFAWISPESLQKVFDAVDTPALRTQIRKNHTSYDGFFSFYSNDLDEWPESVLGWDHNQIKTLLEVFADMETTSGDFDQYAELSLMEDSRGNGSLDDILFSNCPELNRLCKIHEYLETRAKRDEVAA